MTRRRFLMLAAGLPVAAVPLALWGAEYHARNFHTVEPGVLYRSGQATPTGLKLLLSAYRIRTVVTLRTVRDPGRPFLDAWESDVCAARGVRHARILPRAWLPDLDNSLPAAGMVREFLDLVGDPAAHPVLVHCFAGIHRTGAMCAAYRIAVQGWEAERAITEMEKYGYESGQSRATIDDYLRALPVNRSVKTG